MTIKLSIRFASRNGYANKGFIEFKIEKIDTKKIKLFEDIKLKENEIFAKWK